MQIGAMFEPPIYLKRTLFPSITGIPASAPMFPRPRIAVPLVTIAPSLFLHVNSKTSFGFFTIFFEIPSMFSHEKKYMMRAR